MAKSPAGTVLARLSVLTPLTDGQLLDRVVAGDEAAFECLVWRHGPIVLGVCRRGLGNADDADDAFQATFLVLFRKAATVRPAERVGAWLHGVAVRAAAKVRTARAKRAAREMAAARPEAVHPAEVDGRVEALDAEIARLPEKYRLPVVLCDLQGEPIRETAERLGWPQGTLASRLARGRELLARRLRTAGWGDEPVPAAAPALTTAQVHAVQAALAGPAGPAEAVAASVLHSLWVANMNHALLSATVALAVLVAVGLGVAATVGRFAAAPVPEPALPRPDVPIDGRWRVIREERDGKVVATPTVGSILVQGDRAEFIAPAGHVLWSLGLSTATPATGPREIDVTPLVAGAGPCRGIYERAGDGLRVCLGILVDGGSPPPHARPDAFRTSEGSPAVLWDLVRDPVAWGPVRGGLQLGVAYPPGTTGVFRAGDRFRVHVLLKNVTDAPIDYAHLDQPEGDVLFGSAFAPWIVDADKMEGKAYLLRTTLLPRRGDGGTTTKKTIDPGAVVTVGSPTYAIEPDAPGVVRIQHRPGRYRFTIPGVSLDGALRAEGFTTGPLPLVIARPDETDLVKLQGNWRLIREEQGGKPVQRLAPTGMLIRDSLCRTYLPDGTFREDEIRLDAAATPKAIDFRPVVKGDAAEPVPAIYDLDGDRLRICVRAETNPNAPRPPEFVAGATAHLQEFERETIAWGAPAEGLRLGVAVSPTSARVGESVTVRLYATNASTEAITFESPALDFHYPFCQPVFLDFSPQRAKLWFAAVPGIRPPLRHARYAVGPQGVVELGSAKLALRGPDAPNVLDATVVVEPGPYGVRFGKFETKGKPKADTGVATLSVGQP